MKGRIFRALFLLCLIPVFSGCYVIRQGMYLLSYQSKAQPIDSLLSDNSLPLREKDFLLTVQDIRNFAVEIIGLEKNKNYSKYIRTPKDHLVDVVSACKADEFSAYKWKFPIFGEFPYKGYYKRKDAEKLSRRMEKKGYDVYIREVDAFSTLGFFADPVYSFMTDYSLYFLANLIIHEQTHASLFLKNQVRFNEELAMFMGMEGALLYISRRNGNSSEVREKIEAYLKDQKTYFSLVEKLRRELEIVYGSDKNRTEILKEKERLIQEFKSDIRKNYSSYFDTALFESVPDQEINNAYILSINRYTGDLSLFYELYGCLNNNLPDTFQAVLGVKDYKGDPKEYIHKIIRETREQNQP